MKLDCPSAEPGLPLLLNPLSYSQELALQDFASYSESVGLAAVVSGYIASGCCAGPLGASTPQRLSPSTLEDTAKSPLYRLALINHLKRILPGAELTIKPYDFLQFARLLVTDFPAPQPLSASTPQPRSRLLSMFAHTLFFEPLAREVESFLRERESPTFGDLLPLIDLASSTSHIVLSAILRSLPLSAVAELGLKPVEVLSESLLKRLRPLNDLSTSQPLTLSALRTPSPESTRWIRSLQSALSDLETQAGLLESSHSIGED